MKKLAVIGKGTAGCISAAYWANRVNDKIDWYFDPNKKAQSVGEGANLLIPNFLKNELGWDYNNLSDIDGTFKHGIRKINWGGSGDFIHTFYLRDCSIHFNATKLQNAISEQLKGKVNFIPTEITDHSQIDANYIIDCSGKPESLSNFQQAIGIPVNAAHVVQSYWDYPKFNYTLTMARPYGWVFGIPLPNRCSIGYLYNKNINTLEEVKEDIKKVFNELNLTPSETTNSLIFNNYYRKKNYTDRVAYNGNSSFFLEPLEATSLASMIVVNDYANKFLTNPKISLDELNLNYTNFLQELEFMITIHYLAGSKFKTKFWDFAKKQSTKFLENYDLTTWNNMIYKDVKEMYKSNIKFHPDSYTDVKEYGSWGRDNYLSNIKELNLFNKLDKFLNK